MADAIIKGKSGKEYLFQSYNLNDHCWPVDIFLYAHLYHHTDNGMKEWKRTTIDKANYKLCLQSDPDVDGGAIKEDLKENEDFKIKIEYR